MMITSPVLLGLLWLVSHFHQGLCQSKDQETHQVYSYTYHFQHNGTTDPKQLVQSLLSDPPGGRGAVVKTFWNPNVRGFVSQGFFPGRPQTNGFQPKIPTFQGIKNVVDENLKRVPNPTPPELIKIPPNVENNIRNIDEEVNRRLNHVSNRLDHLHPGPVQGPGGVPRGGLPNLNLNQIPLQPVVNNGLVTDVKTFEKDLPNGKIFEKIETFSYNPTPGVNNAGGHQQNQNQRGFGRTVSYFRKEHRTGGPPFNQINQDHLVNEERNSLIPLRNAVENFNQHGVNQNNNFNHVNEVNNIIKNVNDKINRGFGQRLNNFQNANIQRPQGNFNQGHNNGRIENRHFHNGINQNIHNNQNNHNSRGRNVNPNHNIHETERPNREFHNRVTQNNNNNNNNGFRNHHNQNFHNQVNQHNDRRIFNNPDSQNFNNNHRFNNGIQNNIPRSNGNQFGSGHIDNQADKVLSTLDEFARNTLNNVGGHPNHDQERRTGGNSFTWDDDNNGWKVMDIHNDWSNRNRPAPNNNNNNRPRLNDIHREQHNNNHHNPIDVLKSTLESLVGRPLPFPTIDNNNNGGQNGNFNNFRGTNEIRAFGVDSVSQNPNSYQRNLQRRYERNFEVNSNSGYQFNRRWSAGDLSKLSSRSDKGPTFKKDYIDVFADDD